jgi:hypothetical protein
MATLSGTAGNDSIPGDPGGIASADSISGLAGGDTLLGLFLNDTLLGGADNDSLSGGSGADSILGEDGNDSISATSGDSIIGGTGSDTIIGTGDGIRAGGSAGDDFISIVGSDNTLLGGADTSNAAAGSDTIASFGDRNVLIGNASDQAFTLSGSFNTLTGLNGGDSVYFDGAGGGGNSLAGSNGTDLLDVGQGGFTLLGLAPDGSSIIGTPGGSQTISGFEGTILCFADGTDILTANGEVRVEKLQAGQLVATVSGQGAPMKPVLWVGRRKIRLAGNPAANLLAPVRIAAGALGECTPHRDLLVSPDHCLYVDGSLVPARLLVNGTSITVERDLADVTYFHVELEGHDVLLANGAAAESWLDAGNRAWFENTAVAMIQVADAPDAYASATSNLCAPVVQGGEKLAAIRDAIAIRALVMANVPGFAATARATAAA